MNPVIGRLIIKDWRLNRLVIAMTVIIGLAALVLSQSKGEAPRLFGAVWFYVALCVLSTMLPSSSILNERKKQTLAFIMSLPITSVQYSIAKIGSVLGMFLIPWLTLVISASLLIEVRNVIPRGAIPMMVILAMLPFIGFCLISAAALVGESEGWLIGASLMCNSSYWFGWYLLAQVPSLTASWKGPVADWNATVLKILSAEVGIVVLTLLVVLFLQSRKRDFI